jgi:hypothetical protein
MSAAGGNSLQQNPDRSDNKSSSSSPEGSTVSIRDCVLCKMTGKGNTYNLEIIVNIAQYETITSGLYEQTIQFSKESFTIPRVIENEKIINAFRIETSAGIEWILPSAALNASETESSQTINNAGGDTIFLCIRDPVSKIYITTGNIIIEKEHRIISTNSVFIEFGNLQYIPGSKPMIDNSVQSNATEFTNELTNDLTESMKNRNLLFYINCIKVFDDIPQLRTGTYDSIKKEVIANFINLIMVKIALHPTEVYLNSRFLSELRKMEIIVDNDNNENKQILELLNQGDKFTKAGQYYELKNFFDVYCNAGRNFTKIFRLKKNKPEFAELIDKTLAGYKAQVDACVAYFNGKKENGIIKELLVSLKNYVTEKIVRPKKFLIINVKTRGEENKDDYGNRKPVNERYKMNTDLERKYLSIDAVKSAVPLYTKVEGRDLMAMNTGEWPEEIAIDPVTKTITANRQNKLVCGPFEYVTHPDLDNKGISELPKIKEIVNMLWEYYYVCVFGKGISGSGKTTLMINNVHGKTEDAKKGVMFHLCDQLHDPKGKFNCNKIIMRRSEICARTGNCDVDKEEYEFTWKQKPLKDSGNAKDAKDSGNAEESYGFFCDTPFFITDYEIAGTDAGMKGYCDLENGSYECDIQDKSLHEVAEILLTKTRAVNATALNRSSSRSHAQIILCIKCGDGTNRFLTIVDAAGKENIITCSYGMLVKYANSFSEKPGERSYFDTTSENPIAPLTRDDIYDFTQVSSLLPIIAPNTASGGGASGDTDKLDQLQKILHVLKGCPQEFSRELIISDDQIRTDFVHNIGNMNKWIEQINTEQSIGDSALEKYPILGKIKDAVSDLNPTEKISIWAKFSDKGHKIANSDVRGDRVTLAADTTLSMVLSIEDKTVDGNAFQIIKKRIDEDSIKLEVKAKTKTPSQKIVWLDTIVNESTEGLKISGIYKKTDVLQFMDGASKTPPDGFSNQITTEIATKDNFKSFYAQYDTFVENIDSWLQNDFQTWKSNPTKGSLTFYTSPNVKIILGPLSTYAEGEHQPLKEFLIDTFPNKKGQQEFYKDAKKVKDQFLRFHKITEFVRPQCEERGYEGSTVINPELDYSDAVINDICVIQNEGRPTLPLQILGNPEPYDDKHIYNILKGASTNGEIKDSIKKSQIIDSMFNIIIDFSRETSQQLSYAEIAKTIKFFFFTVVNWSPDTELKNKVQYIHTVKLRKLLKQMKYESDFEEYSKKRPEYLPFFNAELAEMVKYYKEQGLERVVEIEVLLGKIATAIEKLAKASTYETAIPIVMEIVNETNNVNASTLIGSIASEGDTCVEQNTVGFGNLTESPENSTKFDKYFSVSLRPQPVG